MDNAQQQIVEAIKNTSNILVTVSTDPSVDGLSAALGLTLLLDKLDKRATAIFSGAIPPAINFLEPAKTFESTADSLRDFIIALDKEKADHLRYKVEGDVVKIFITPYKTTLSQADLEFSQGDYNVELVIALGVTSQDNLDKALDAHGKILHDAKVMTITSGEAASDLGGVDWHDATSSSLSEMIVALSEKISDDKKVLDEQIATSLLTGVVSATDRFSNDHTTSRAMTMAAQLMAVGANQQLIAAKLEEGHDIAPGPVESEPQDQSVENNEVKDSTELVIERDQDQPSPQGQGQVQEQGQEQITNEILDKKEEKIIEPTQTEEPAQSLQEQTPKVEMSREDNDQIELERQLAGVSQPNANATLADIEKELEQASDTPDTGIESLSASKDTAMPGFEPIKSEQPVVDTGSQLATDETVVPELVAQAPVVTKEQAPPEIATSHNASDVVLPQETPPINSIQTENNSDSVVNPFNVPQTSHEGITVNPSGLGGGTSEGAAVLATPPSTTLEPTVAQSPAIASASVVDPTAAGKSTSLEVPELPPLPPLPPLPSDGSVPPLPPPPPAPQAFSSQSGTMPSGAVSGDVFGDSSASSTPPAPSASEPGIFKIPGQG